MNKLINYAVLALAFFLAGPARAADFGSPDEAVAMVLSLIHI